ncbi:MAG: bifunctional phosphopantothenoylcysteine decarboxylase/phosphopantothenate--cysteine ligase CoaBC [Bacteroidia bacterium]|nr:bifunctional phosphopantothenoylcysteine decarboxylase/phosphopantothenate--cysteine ligase CoaBC [Bacteroidia bacterium]
MLKGKKIVLGVSGGIAAYKTPLLVRLLVKEGAEVKVVMTPDAENFVTRQTLSVVSKNKVYTEFFDEEFKWNNHVELGLWADIFVVAPATANTLAKMAHGICDNLLIAAYMSSRAPVFVAPAMDADMYLHFSTTENISLLKENGSVHIIPPETGELASGLLGTGRMAEPEEIFRTLKQFFAASFAGKRVLINAGPTYEAIDPVRFIGNRSSGKTGVWLAEAFALLGAHVTLVLGPSELQINDPTINCIRVESADEMRKACMDNFSESAIFIASAAVADYKPLKAASQKIKKSAENISLDLVKNPDILAEAGKLKTDAQFLVGFALETENQTENAVQKLKKKNLDLIIVNSPNQKDEGFGVDTNRISVIDKHNKITNFELKHKRQLAMDLAELIFNYTNKK